MAHEHTPHHGHQHGPDAPGDSAMPDLLDLDARVLHEYWTSAVDLVVDHAPDQVARIVDLGSGTGTAAIAFAAQYPDAEVIAVDAAPEMLERLTSRAGGRVRTLAVDLDTQWPINDLTDITWASMSLHHLADPDAVLAQVNATTRAGGIVAVVEFDAPPRFLPDDLGIGRPGLEQRCLDALAERHRDDLPELGADWPTRVQKAGFELLVSHDFVLDVRSADGDAATYAELWFGRLLGGAGEHLDDDDKATMAELLDPASPHSLRRRSDLHIRGVRTVTIGRHG